MSNNKKRCYFVHTEESQFNFSAHIQLIGKDILVSIFGGEAPHIGAVAMAQPRPSLKDPNVTSATSSVFTYIGHKEDDLAKKSAETLASVFNTNVVVTAGIHWDNLLPEEISKVLTNSNSLVNKIIKTLQSEI